MHTNESGDQQHAPGPASSALRPVAAPYIATNHDGEPIRHPASIGWPDHDSEYWPRMLEDVLVGLLAQVHGKAS
ncbi:hypothetical protein ABJI51_16720 [Amycolatopsis sp. NEAU-NG30]|uniref:Uncharacterized protein n=1 Tax=Amycolatopsis melonis TaxID=3156488 RepID=A0ABV0LEJ9_9PSEU